VGAVTWLLTGAVAVAVAVVRRQVVRTTVRGHSMAPTYTDGERLLALRRRRYRRGDVIVFRVAAEAATGAPPFRIKRIVAVAGDPAPTWMPARGSGAVPAGHLAIAGDNTAHSQDSRHLGYISLNAVIGRPARSRQGAAPGSGKDMPA
jgi:signal peptidase I